MTRQTPMWDQHREAGARLVDFAGWEMPLQYAGIQQEHRSVRTRAGAFDVSHMGRLYLHGEEAFAYLDRLLPCDVARLTAGRMAYTVLCAEDGGAIDDLAVYRLEDDGFLLVVNAARTAADAAWIEARKAALDSEVRVADRTPQQGMVAVQGPEAEAIVAGAVDAVTDANGAAVRGLGFFRFVQARGPAGEWLISRSGYTGEDGFEIICPAADGPGLWARLVDGGASPTGLAARDTLRLEAGLCLYGHELAETISPVEAGLEWTLALDKAADFPGRAVLRRQQRDGVARRLVGFRVTARGIPRTGQVLQADGEDAGVVTSGTHSPTLEAGIGMGYLRADRCEPGQPVEVLIRDRPVAAEVVKLPFVPSRVRRRKRRRPTRQRKERQ